MNFKNYTLTICFALLAFSAIAQLQEKDPIYSLFDRSGDEINCLAIKTLLSSYSENLDEVDCIGTSYNDSENGFTSKIPYSKTKAISAKIDNKKIELLSSLSLDNFHAALETLVDFASETSRDVSKDEATQKIKDEEFRLGVSGRLEAARRDFDAILKTEARNPDETENTPQVNEDPLADQEELDEADAEPVRAVDEMGPELADDTDWIIWFVIVLALLSVAMGLLTLMSLKKNQSELNALKAHVYGMPKDSDGPNKAELSNLKEESERLGNRLNEFEGILFQLKNKLDN